LGTCLARFELYQEATADAGGQGEIVLCDPKRFAAFSDERAKSRSVVCAFSLGVFVPCCCHDVPDREQ
jgi:hypothetical protein